MDWDFIGQMLLGAFWTSHNLMVSTPTYIAIIPLFLYIFAPKWSKNLKKLTQKQREERTTKLRIFAALAIILLLFISLVLSANYLYQNKAPSLEQQLIEWTLSSGSSVQTIDPSVPDLRGRSVIFALKLNYNNVVVDIVKTVGDSETLYFESPIDDSTSLNIINSLSDERKKNLAITLETEFLRTQGIYYSLSSAPMYIYTVIPIKSLTQNTFIEQLTTVSKEGLLTRKLIGQAK
jgi:hypothetical protein